MRSISGSIAMNRLSPATFALLGLFTLVSFQPCLGQVISEEIEETILGSDMAEFVLEPVVKRFRIVRIDYEAFIDLLVSAETGIVDRNPSNEFVLELFDDVVMTVRFSRSCHGPGFWRGDFEFAEDSEHRSRGDIVVDTKRRIVEGQLSPDRRFFFLSFDRESLVHVAWEAYPERMPRLD
jgi:hypothetical protein